MSDDVTRVAPVSDAGRPEGPGATTRRPVPTPPLDARTTIAVLAVGTYAAAVMPDPVPGVGLATTGLIGAGVVLARRRHDGRRGAWRTAGLVVAAVATLLPAVSDADWVVSPVLLVAFGTAALALAGGRTWLGLVRALARCLPEGGRAPVAVVRGLRSVLPTGVRSRPVIRASLLTVVLLAVFGGLFASADRLFGRLVERFLLPEWQFSALPARAFVLTAVTIGITILVRLSRRSEDDQPLRAPGRRLEGIEWRLPLVALLVLFATFLAVQFGALFGGHDWVSATAGLTYAEHARGGFAQLVVVALLTLLVVAATSRYAAVATPEQQRLQRGLLAGLCGLTLVVLASALHRLLLYQDAFGLTRARFGAQAIIWWLAGMFALVLLAGWRRRTTWLPRAVALATAIAVVGVGFVQPDAHIARWNVERFAAEGAIDVFYLSGLSADAVPALASLPDEVRACVLEAAAERLLEAGETDGWSWNASRARAADVLVGVRAHGVACAWDGVDRHGGLESTAGW
ncbi:DUF4153 domain-containing protein [Egicoccus sp. AB-alg2]|uniref:DUF4153 domain-containing protein n=1 Tax=Egicoccus sp. AB-alg2 TaxID=3242693 RepID=UPI00359DDBF8